MRNAVILWSWVALAAASLAVELRSAGDCATTDTAARIEISREVAMGKALEWTGAASVTNRVTGALFEGISAVTLIDTTTPFLHTRMNGKSAWLVVLPAVDLGDWLGQRDTVLPRDFNIFVDRETGAVLKIESSASHYDSTVIRKASWHRAETDPGAFHYLGFPCERPTLSFFEVLRIAEDQVSKSMQIDAVCCVIPINEVDRSQPDNDSCTTVWDIHLYGLPPRRIHPQPAEEYSRHFRTLPIYMCNHWRTVIDATTGVVYRSSNLPQPALDSEP